MKGKIFAAFMLVMLVCGCAYALSDDDYKKMMKDSGFAEADKQLTKAYRDAMNSLSKNKAAQEKLRQDQRNWIASGRDEDAEALMKRYSRTRSYALATRARAEDLPDIAKSYLQNTQTSSAPAKQRTRTPTVQTPHTDTEGFPTLGMCTGNNVRLRDYPGTDSKILGAANDTDILILLGVRRIDGSSWYAVDNPIDEGTAWIFGKYIDTYKGDAFGTPAYNMALQLRMDFGMRPEKAKILHGKPERETRDSFSFDGMDEEIPQLTLEYPGFRLQYVNNRLRHVEVTERGQSFGVIQVGDSMQKLRDTLGKPSGEGDEGCTYELSEIESLQFELRDGVITWMGWDEYLEG